MSPAFRVEDTFTIDNRGLFVILGHVAEGVIRAGMHVSVDRATLPPLRARILSIERTRPANPVFDLTGV